MAKIKEHNLAQQSDSRVLATQQIWSCATGMFVICMVFGGPNRNTVIPPMLSLLQRRLVRLLCGNLEKKLARNCNQISYSK